MDDAAAKPTQAFRIETAGRASRAAAVAAVVILLVAGAASGLRRPQPDSGSDLPVLHAGAGAMLEPARGLRRPDLRRPAGLCRARRLPSVRAHAARRHQSAARHSHRGRCLRAVRAADCADRVSVARRLFRDRHLGRGRGLSSRLRPVQAARRRHRNVAHAVRHIVRSRHRMGQDLARPAHAGGARHHLLLGGAGAGGRHARLRLSHPSFAPRPCARCDPRPRGRRRRPRRRYLS